MSAAAVRLASVKEFVMVVHVLFGHKVCVHSTAITEMTQGMTQNMFTTQSTPQIYYFGGTKHASKPMRPTEFKDLLSIAAAMKFRSSEQEIHISQRTQEIGIIWLLPILIEAKTEPYGPIRPETASFVEHCTDCVASLVTAPRRGHW